MFIKYSNRSSMASGSVVLALVNVLFFGSHALSVPGVGDLDNHICRLMSARGCNDTGNQRCSAKFLGSPAYHRSCDGDCFHCDGTANANESLCVYVEGKLCHRPISNATLLCGEPGEHQFTGRCGDGNQEGIAPLTGCSCLHATEDPLGPDCNQEMKKCFANPFPNNPDPYEP